MNLDKARQLFFEESSELLARMEADLLALEREPDNSESVASLFRAAHTIKGSAGIFGFQAITDFFHSIEHLLSHWREGLSRPAAGSVQRLLEARDLAVQMINNAMAGLESDAGLDNRRHQLSAALLSDTNNAGGAQAAAVSPSTASASDQSEGTSLFQFGWRIGFRPEGSVFKLGLDPLAPLRELAANSQLNDVRLDFSRLPPLSALDAEECCLAFSAELSGPITRQDIENAFEFFDGVGELNIEALAAPEEQSAPSSAQTPAPVAAGPAGATVTADAPATRFLRVETAKLDQLVNLVGELVIASANISQIASLRGDAQLSEASESILRMIGDLREQSLRVRMVQLGETFARFHRVVRDLGAETGKSVRLAISGGETELDKTVVEKIVDPLMHLVRNAIDHGVEDPVERAASGKPPEATIVLQAYQETGSIVLEVRDDGRGFQLERILQTARRRGLVDAGAELNEAQILALVFQPGFSTAQQVSAISGRGVGLDVVQKNIESLRGGIQIENFPGQGSVTRIRLPLTLAIIEGFMVQVGGERYILPMDLVLECVDAPVDQSGAGAILNLRGEALPCVSLGRLFGAQSVGRSVVVVQYAERKAGLIVDQLAGEYQTVIKPLGRLFDGLRGISGATILGDGAVALILDIPSLVDLAARLDARPAAIVSA